MKKDNYAVQVGVIIFSSFILIGGLFFSFNLIASQVSPANIFEAEIDEINRVTVPLTYENHIKKGDGLFASDQYLLAASEFALAVNIQDKNPEAYAKLGLTQLELNDPDKAVANLRRALDLSPNDSEINTAYALSLIQNGMFDEARDVLGDAGSQEDHFYLGGLDSLSGSYEDAKAHYQAAFSLDGQIAGSVIQNFLTAYENYDEQLGKDNIYLKALLSQAMIDANQFRLSEEISLEILNEKNDYRDVWILFGYAKLKTEQLEDAKSAFEQAKNLDSTKAETRYFLATTLYEQGNYSQAVREYELALLYGFQPEQEAYWRMAESHLYLENYGDALSAYEHLIKIEHASVDSFVKPIWIALTELKDLDRGLTLAQDAVTYFPEDGMSYNLLAWTHIEREEYEDAQKELDNAFEYSPFLPAAHYNQGLLFQRQDLQEDAKESYKKAHDLAPLGDSIRSMAAEKYNSL